MTSPRVLVVDDDESVRVLLRLLLEPEGFEVAAAPDGMVGLEAAREEPYDAVLLDVTMPRMDGVTVARRLRADPVTAALPIVFVSGVRETDELRALAQGVVAKPLDVDALVAAVRAAIAHAGGVGQVRSGS